MSPLLVLACASAVSLLLDVDGSITAITEPVASAQEYEWCISESGVAPDCYRTVEPETLVQLPHGVEVSVDVRAIVDGWPDGWRGASRTVVVQPVAGDTPPFDGIVGINDYLKLVSAWGGQ